jgi:histidine triad (HIT) family protein
MPIGPLQLTEVAIPPWYTYVMDQDCIFCRIIRNEEPAFVIDETDVLIVFLSLDDHPLVVPKAHVSDIFALDDRLGAALMAETIRVAKAVKQALGCDGVYLTQANGVAAGQDVFHFHLHVYPRWQAGNPDATPPQELAQRIASALPTPSPATR